MPDILFTIFKFSNSRIFKSPFLPFAPSCSRAVVQFPNRCAYRDSASLRVQSCPRAVVPSSPYLALCPIFSQSFPQNSKDDYFKIEEETLVFYVFVIDAHLFGVGGIKGNICKCQNDGRRLQIQRFYL